MKQSIKQTSVLLLSVLATLLSSSSIASQASSNTEKNPAAIESTSIVIGSMGADADIWRFIANTDLAKQEKIVILVKEINDPVTLNNATVDKQVDVNAFQSWAYYKIFNETNGNKLAALSTTYLEPMGLYSKKHTDLNALPQGATVAIPNDVANMARALLLLEEVELIRLQPNFNPVAGTVQDIADNPKKLKIKTVHGASGPRVLADVDFAAIGNTYALEGGLNVIKDALAYEKTSDRVVNNINILVTVADRADDVQLKKLVDLYHQPAVNAYIEEHFGGTKLQVKQPISFLN